MHYVMILLYTHIRILEKGFLNVPHKDFGCSNDNFVNEFSSAASHLFFCDHCLWLGLVWLGFGLCWLWLGLAFGLGWLWLGLALALALAVLALVGFGLG